MRWAFLPDSCRSPQRDKRRASSVILALKKKKLTVEEVCSSLHQGAQCAQASSFLES